MSDTKKNENIRTKEFVEFKQRNKREISAPGCKYTSHAVVFSKIKNTLGADAATKFHNKWKQRTFLYL
jgi:hypothetical protein